MKEKKYKVIVTQMTNEFIVTAITKGEAMDKAIEEFQVSYDIDRADIEEVEDDFQEKGE